MILKKRKKVINILTPNQLENVPNSIVELYQELEEFIITDFSRRLKATGQITSTAEWQRKQAELTGINNINQKVASILKLSDAQIESLFPSVALASFKAEMLIYEKAKLDTIDYKSKPIQDYIKAAIKQTKGDIENITQSLGFAEVQNGHVVYSDVAKFYQKELNVAHIKIQSGVSDYNSAIKQAIKKISDSGLRNIIKPTVDYPSGWSNSLDVAVRRSVLTSTHQMNQQIINHCAEKIISDKEQIYYEVTAHAAARTGIGINNHAGWQGKVYKLIGSDKDYPNLKESTGLGDLLGLSGINCKHSYFIFIPNVSTRTYTDEQLKNIDPQPFEYKGKEYTAYEATQQQRKIETAIRQTKRELIGYKESGLDDEFKQASVLLNQQKREYKQFSEAADIRVKNERSQVQGFDRSISQKAVQASKS